MSITQLRQFLRLPHSPLTSLLQDQKVIGGGGIISQVTEMEH